MDEKNMFLMERKIDMSLDDIIKMRKAARMPPASKKLNVGRVLEPRHSFQNFAAMRSSNLRQAKLAEARSQGGANRLNSVIAAARIAPPRPFPGARAMARNSNGFNPLRQRRPSRRRGTQEQNDSSNYNAGPGNGKISAVNDINHSNSFNPLRWRRPSRRRGTQEQNGSSNYKAGPGNVKISIINDINHSTLGARVQNTSTNTGVTGVSPTKFVQIEGVEGQSSKFGTLDALFASIHKERIISSRQLSRGRNWRTGALPPFSYPQQLCLINNLLDKAC